MQMVYFLKDADHFVTRQNISQLVQFGVLKGSSTATAAFSDKARRSSSGASSSGASSAGVSAGGIATSLQPLLRLMGSVYLPQVAHSGSWPDAVRKDFLSYTHRFMSSLTEVVHEAQGRTVLYMPSEELNCGSTANEAARDKHLVQRLETTLMYWTRQVANVLNKQDCCDLGQRAGPLVEIEFWRSRSQDLNGISAHLEGKQVTAVATRFGAAVENAAAATCRCLALALQLGKQGQQRFPPLCATSCPPAVCLASGVGHCQGADSVRVQLSATLPAAQGAHPAGGSGCRGQHALPGMPRGSLPATQQGHAPANTCTAAAGPQLHPHGLVPEQVLQHT